MLMQEFLKSIFYITYLTIIIYIGIILVRNNYNNRYFKYFGYMALILVVGDAIHLIPRIYTYLIGSSLKENASLLGFGTLVASITMTIFYLLFYSILKMQFSIKSKILDLSIYILVLGRFFLVLLPQNEWFVYESPLIWGIYRNIPFVVMGLILVFLAISKGIKCNNRNFILYGVFILLSFLFYIPFVTLVSTYPVLGVFMFPKTIAYLCIVLLAYNEFRYIFLKKVCKRQSVS